MTTRKKFSISYRDAIAGALIFFNVFIVAPGGFALKNLWQFKTDTEKSIQDLGDKINALKTEIAQTYATGERVQNLREEVDQRLISLNSALLNIKK